MKKDIRLKRLLSLVLTVTLCMGVALTTTSCTLFDNGEEFSEAKEHKDKKENSQDKDKEEPTPEPEETPEPNPEPTPETADLGEGYSLCPSGEFEAENMSFVIPEEFASGVYMYNGKNGISFYQKLSYDNTQGMGYLFGFYSSDILFEYAADNELIAFTDDTYFYIDRPTDVPFVLEDPSISDDYYNLKTYEQQILDSVEINLPNVNMRPHDYVIPNSDIALISEDLCFNMDSKTLWLARNELFARYGMQFENEYLNNHFTKKPWYHCEEGKKVLEEDLNEIETANLAIIKEAEERFQKSDYPKEMKFGKAYKEDLDGDGTEESLKVTCTKDKKNSYHYIINININGVETDIETLNAFLDEPEKDYYYITQIRSYDDAKQIALFDYGPSDDLVTDYFYYEDETLGFIGELGGFTTKDYLGFDPFCIDSNVICVDRADLLTYTHYYTEAFYNIADHSFVDMSTRFCEITDAQDHKTLKDIKVYTNPTYSEEFTIKKGTVVYFESQNAQEGVVKIVTEDGVDGYLRVDPYEDIVMPDGSNSHDMFENIIFCD